MKDKVLILASVASMIEQFNMSNITILLRQGKEVHVACNFVDGGTIPNSKVKELQSRLDSMDVIQHQIDFDRNAFNLPSLVSACKQTLLLFENEKYDLVHCHSPIGGVCARVAGRKTGTKIIYTAHGFHFYSGGPLFNWFIFYPIEKYLSRYTDMLIVINQEDLKLAKNRFRAKEVKYVPGVGVDIEKFQPALPSDKVGIRKTLGLDPDIYTIVYVGELSSRKNQIMILQSAKKLKNKNQKFKLLLIGTGPKEIEYANYIRDNKLADYVKLTGYTDDVSSYMRAADLAISTSKQEGLPVNIMEAMATGLPVIATSCRGNIDLVKDQLNGFIVNLNDVDGLTKRIMQIKNDTQKHKEFSELNRRHIEGFSKYIIDIKMEEIYSESE